MIFIMNYWQKPLVIAGKEYPRFIGGPLDGITDSPFRRVVRRFSQKELLYTEMRHVSALIRSPLQINFQKTEKPLNFQVAATTEQDIQQACELLLQKEVDMVDLNIGCPAPIMVKSGGGSALMADLPRLEKIVKLFRQNLSIPFTVKIRAGFKCTNAVEVSQLLQDCGVDALAIHPRLQTQKFEGKLNYSLVQEIKKKLTIPVIFSGGVVNFSLAKMVYELTGVDGFLISRGIWGRPWKLFELEQHMNDIIWKIDKTIVINSALEHFKNMHTFYGARGLHMFRKHISLYLKGIGADQDQRASIIKSTSYEEIIEFFNTMAS